MNRRGSILLIVLLLAGLLAVFASVAAEVQRSAVLASRSYAEDLRAETAMRAMLERVVALTGTAIQQQRAAATLHLDGADVVITLRDEASKIDLNYAPAELLSGIFRVTGVESALADSYAARILDWREEGDKPRPGGAKREAYRAAGRVDGPRNAPFEHVAELALVLGIPPETAAAVAPYLTVASGRAKINPLIADAAVLLAIPGVDASRVAEFVKMRDGSPRPFDSLISVLGPVQKFVSDESGSAVSFMAQVRLGPSSIRRFSGVVAVIEGDSEPYRILAWNNNPPGVGEMP